MENFRKDGSSLIQKHLLYHFIYMDFLKGKTHKEFKAVVDSSNEALVGKEHKRTLLNVYNILYFNVNLI